MSSVVEDKSFHVPVEPAVTALRTAKKVVNWASTNEEAFSPLRDWFACLYAPAFLTSECPSPVQSICEGNLSSSNVRSV